MLEPPNGPLKTISHLSEPEKTMIAFLRSHLICSFCILVFFSRGCVHGARVPRHPDQTKCDPPVPSLPVNHSHAVAVMAGSLQLTSRASKCRDNRSAVALLQD